MLDNNPPLDAREANHQGSDRPSRNADARAATATASTASPTVLPVGETGPSNGSSPCANTVNHARIASAFLAKRRSQPRTVDGGNPNTAAARRWP